FEQFGAGRVAEIVGQVRHGGIPRWRPATPSRAMIAARGGRDEACWNGGVRRRRILPSRNTRPGAAWSSECRARAWTDPAALAAGRPKAGCLHAKVCPAEYHGSGEAPEGSARRRGAFRVARYGSAP